MRRVSPLVALAVAALLLLPGQASAAPTVSISGVTVTGGSGAVTGTASFEAITEALSVGGTNTNWANAAVADAAGINLVDAKIAPLANNAGLRFIWELSALPAQVLPEVVRYTWSFKIGTNQYQLQAKRTNLASITTAEDPVNHIQQAAAQKEFFQLRGACVTSYEGAPVSGCYHLAFLNGSIDVAGKKVTMDLPYLAKDEIGRVVTPDFKPGVAIEANETAGMSITAAFQAVVGNTATSDYTNGWSPYYAGPQVSLAVAAAGVDASTLTYGAPVTLSASGFSGTVSGLTAAKNTVFARACSGLDCSYTSFKAL
jgi:hypothetical protein